jgi:hypothetical protein
MRQVVALTTCDRLVEILERYVSRITVSSMLTNVLSQRGMERRDIDGENLLDIVGEVMLGLRLFCDQDRLPDLMIELAELCDHETQPLSFGPISHGPGGPRSTEGRANAGAR